MADPKMTATSLETSLGGFLQKNEFSMMCPRNVIEDTVCYKYLVSTWCPLGNFYCTPLDTGSELQSTIFSTWKSQEMHVGETIDRAHSR